MLLDEMSEEQIKEAIKKIKDTIEPEALKKAIFDTDNPWLKIVEKKDESNETRT